MDAGVDSIRPASWNQAARGGCRAPRGRQRFDLGKLSFRLGLEVALFADAGIAWSESREFTIRRARGGLGAGLRILTPVSEMVRLDVGWSPEGGFHFHFAGGSKPRRQRERLR